MFWHPDSTSITLLAMNLPTAFPKSGGAYNLTRGNMLIIVCSLRLIKSYHLIAVISSLCTVLLHCGMMSWDRLAYLVSSCW